MKSGAILAAIVVLLASTMISGAPVPSLPAVKAAASASAVKPAAKPAAPAVKAAASPPAKPVPPAVKGAVNLPPPAPAAKPSAPAVKAAVPAPAVKAAAATPVVKAAASVASTAAAVLSHLSAPKAALPPFPAAAVSSAESLCTVRDRDERGIAKFALLVPTTTRNTKVNSLEDLPIMKMFLPTFKTTAKSPTIEYHLYLGYDKGDQFYDVTQNRIDLIRAIVELDAGFTHESIHLIELSPGKLVGLWNQLFHLSYAEGMHYFFQIGDDVEFVTPGWGDRMISTLRNNPTLPNFGMVGPQDALAPQMWAEQEAVSRSHMLIFGYLFDPTFHDVSCDVWLSQAYGKQNSFVLNDMQVRNIIRGTRYKMHPEKARHMRTTVTLARQRACQYMQQCSPTSATQYCHAVQTDPIVGTVDQKFRSMRFMSSSDFSAKPAEAKSPLHSRRARSSLFSLSPPLLRMV